MDFEAMPVTPFLFAYREEPELEPMPGRFDPVTDLWVIPVAGTDEPMVLRDCTRCATETITRVRAEATDED